MHEAADRRHGPRRWGHIEELLALVLEQLGHLHRVTAALGGAKPYELPKPIHYPRPDEDPAELPPAADRDTLRRRFRPSNPPAEEVT